MKLQPVTALRVVTPLVLLAACDAPAPTQPAAPAAPASPSFAAIPPGLAARDQAVVDAFAAGAHPGAVLDMEAGCALLPGFLDAETGDLLAFGGLFPEVCGPGTFARTNPDGTVDWHGKARGGFFLLVFDPFTIYGSEGSDVRWEVIQQEDGQSILNVNGTLGDGSRVRAHFVNGHSSSENGRLWVEGLGYVVGGG